MRKQFLSVVIVCFIMVAMALGFAWRQLQLYMDSPLALPPEGMALVINKGQVLNQVVSKLAAEGQLSDPLWFKVFIRVSGRGSAIKAGDYWLSPGTTHRQLLAKLEQGDVRYYQVTLVEGWTITQVLEALRKEDRLQKQIDINKRTIRAKDLGLQIAEAKLEGLLFPDTYRFHSSSTDVELLVQAYNRMSKVLSEEWVIRESGLPYKSPYEALVMASLVEKETGVASERAQIAGVFVRRLQKGMRLQTDPTIIYGLGDEFDGNLRSHHLKDDSNLYNTYRHNGLPPTPIALAGRAAIHAVLHPAKGDALYFVAKGDGSHYFSNTLEEHQKAVRKYQIYQRKKNYSSAPPSKSSS